MDPLLLLLPGSSTATAFDVLILEKFGGAIPAGARYLVERVLAPAFPQLALLWRYREEVVAAILLNLQHTLLSRSSGTLQEMLYGWARVSSDGRVDGDARAGLHPVSTDNRRLWLSVLCVVLVPYVRQKLAAWQEEARRGETRDAAAQVPHQRGVGAAVSEIPEGAAAAQTRVSGFDVLTRALRSAVSPAALRSAASAAPTVLLAALDLLELGYLLTHAVGAGAHPSPWLHLAGVRLVRASDIASHPTRVATEAVDAPREGARGSSADASAVTPSPTPLPPASLPSAETDPVSSVGSNASSAAPSLADRALMAARFAVVGTLVALKLYQWVAQARAARAAAPSSAATSRTANVRPPAWKAIPPPPVELALLTQHRGATSGASALHEDVPEPDGDGTILAVATLAEQFRGHCPLCGRSPLVAPTATPAGIVYCRACIVDHLSRPLSSASGSAGGAAESSRDAHPFSECPVSRQPCSISDLRRIYEVM